MALLAVRVYLRGYGGMSPSSTSFFDLLSVTPDDGFEVRASDNPRRSALLTLVEVAADDCLGAEEPSEEFAARISSALMRASAWLSDDREQGLVQWRKQGNTADVFVDGWSDQNQLYLEFPPEFLLACGRLGL